MAKTTKTAVAVASNTTGIAIPLDKTGVTATIEGFKAKLAALKQNSPEAVSINIEVSAGGWSGNIKDVDKVTTLLEISSSIHARAKAYSEEIARYELTGKVKEFTTSEKTVTQWKEIIDKAIFELINKKQIKQLEDAINKLSKFEDEQTKFQREIGGILEGASELLS